MVPPSVHSRAAQDLVPRLCELALDLWWTWQPEAQELFASIDPVLWKASNHNPLAVIDGATDARLEALAEDEGFLAALERVQRAHRDYHRESTWFAREHRGRDRKLRVAYFCSEYALHESMPQYSGGLGVLAGDHLKSASDLGIPLVAVGLLYGHGYYRQEFRADGTTRVLYPRAPFDLWPLQDTGVCIDCPIGSRTVKARVWRVQVGRVDLHLLDTDLEENRREDRLLTEGLYKGEPELRMRQQALLGVGGVLALQALGIEPTVWHLNEGHAAFASLERLAQLVDGGMEQDAALEKIRASTVFTTHTPVEAGHDRYDRGEAARWLRPVLRRLGWTARSLFDFGREDRSSDQGPVCMTVLALNTATRVNGVAALHGDTSRRMWQSWFGSDTVEAVPIGHVTNGVHVPTWMDPMMRPVLRKHLKKGWDEDAPRPRWEAKEGFAKSDDLWMVRGRLRARLVHFVRERLVQQAQRRGAEASELAALWQALDPEALTFGFARRFATYKRAPLVFRDPERLAALLNDADRPVQIVFAGKAHPRDEAGQAFAQKVFRMSQRKEFRGRVAVLEEYDMNIGRMLTSGVDVWLNTPRRPYEASGTSGMKPPLHGGLNCSILDGWWPEGYDKRNGWVIGSEEPAGGERAQDKADAESLYALLEDEIVPQFYERDRRGQPRKWMRRMQASLLSVPPAFSTHRMLGDYLEQAYLPAHRDA